MAAPTPQPWRTRPRKPSAPSTIPSSAVGWQWTSRARPQAAPYHRRIVRLTEEGRLDGALSDRSASINCRITATGSNPTAFASDRNSQISHRRSPFSSRQTQF